MAKILTARLGDLEGPFREFCENEGVTPSEAVRLLVGIALGDSPAMIGKREAVMSALAATRRAVTQFVPGFADRVGKQVKEDIG